MKRRRGSGSAHGMRALPAVPVLGPLNKGGWVASAPLWTRRPRRGNGGDALPPSCAGFIILDERGLRPRLGRGRARQSSSPAVSWNPRVS